MIEHVFTILTQLNIGWGVIMLLLNQYVYLLERNLKVFNETNNIL